MNVTPAPNRRDIENKSESHKGSTPLSTEELRKLLNSAGIASQKSVEMDKEAEQRGIKWIKGELD